ncbi:hypothetical protein LUZ60_008019 [Juncus effusus]|nr:hypothetical protein LUZ60_008019 [Juncus effusus]
MEKTKRAQIPSFGDWNYYNELPITQYFDSAMQAGDLFYVSSPVKPTFNYNQSKIKQGKGCVEKQKMQVVAIKPVDADLYKISPELLYQKPRRRSFLRGLLTGCLCLNCVA